MVDIQEIRTFIEEQKLRCRAYAVCDEYDRDPSLLNIGNRIWDGIILEEDIGIELGSKKNPIAKAILHVEDTSAVHDNRITLIGQKISFLRRADHSFGFLILFSGKSLSDSDFRKIQRNMFLSNSIEGIFEKRYGRGSWYQISRSLLKKGINFSHIGFALMKLLKEKFPHEIDAIEIIFAVDDEKTLDYIQQLQDMTIATVIKQFQNKIKEIQKRRPDCDLTNECNVCDNQEICDQIRDMIVKRNKMRRPTNEKQN